MPKNLYNGYNLIYEQMQDNQKPTTDTNTIDPISTITQLFAYLNSLIVIYNLDNDSSEGFDSITKELQGCSSLDDIRKDIANIIAKITFPDDNSKKAVNDYFAGVFDILMKIPDINNKFGDIKKKLDELVSSCKNRYSQVEQVKAVAEALLREDHGFLEDSKGSSQSDDDDDDDDDDDSGDDTPSNKWYIALANHVMDMATTFSSETTPPLLDPKVGADQQVQAILPKAKEFLASAQQLQVDKKRKGFIINGKINTIGGAMKGRDFRIACENLIDEIKRQRDILNKIKQTITKVPVPPPIPAPKSSAGPISNTGVNTSGKDQNNINPGNCKFPIAISLHVCDIVKKLQTHLMGIPCINDQLTKHGGVDGKYGKFTSMVVNCAYSVISKNDKFSSSVLTQEMYDGIMKLDTGAKVSENVKSILSTKIFEVEAAKKEETLKFEDFGKIFDKSKKILEQEQKNISDVDLICKKVSDRIKLISGSGNKVAGGTGTGTGSVPPTGSNGPSSPVKSTGADDSIKRFKPMPDGTYGIAYDESVGHFLEKSAIVAGSAAIIAASAGAGTVLVVGAGAAGLGAHELWGGRKLTNISIKSGFLDKRFCDVMALGLVHTLDGFVSREDIQAIMQSLCYIKGAYTVDNGKAISAWSYIKNKYHSQEKDEDLSTEVFNWGTSMVRDIKAFPNFKQRKEPATETSPEDAKNLIQDATKALDGNESNFSKYLATMDPKKIQEIENPSDEMEGGDTKSTVQASKTNTDEEK